MAVMTSFVFQGFVFRNSVEISKLLSFIGNTGFWAEVLPGTNKLYHLQKFKISNRELEELKVCSRVTGIQMWGLHPNAAPQKTKILNLILSHGFCIIRGFTRKKNNSALVWQKSEPLPPLLHPNTGCKWQVLNV